MDYTNLNTYKTQAKCVVKLHKLKRDKINHTFKIAELRKLKQVYSNTFDAEDSDNIMKDIQMLENKVREDQWGASLCCCC